MFSGYRRAAAAPVAIFFLTIPIKKYISNKIYLEKRNKEKRRMKRVPNVRQFNLVDRNVFADDFMVIPLNPIITYIFQSSK